MVSEPADFEQRLCDVVRQDPEPEGRSADVYLLVPGSRLVVVALCDLGELGDVNHAGIGFGATLSLLRRSLGQG